MYILGIVIILRNTYFYNVTFEKLTLNHHFLSPGKLLRMQRATVYGYINILSRMYITNNIMVLKTAINFYRQLNKRKQRQPPTSLEMAMMAEWLQVCHS